MVSRSARLLDPTSAPAPEHCAFPWAQGKRVPLAPVSALVSQHRVFPTPKVVILTVDSRGSMFVGWLAPTPAPTSEHRA